MGNDSLADDIAAEEMRTKAALAAAGLVETSLNDEGLVFPLPEGAVIQSIVASYDTKGTGRKVRCSACPQHQKHYRGFRVLLQDSRHARLGIDCGEQRFGKDAWASVQADYSRRVELATFQARIQPTLRVIECVEPLLTEWHVRTNKLARWLGDLRRELPEVADALGIVAHRHFGRFEIEELVRREGVNARGQRYVRKEPQTRILGRLPYPPMFLGTTPTRGLNGAGKCIGDAARMLQSKADAQSLAKAFRAMQNARQYLTEADEAHVGALSNLDVAWLKPMCQWLNQADYTTGEYWMDGPTLFHANGRSEVAIEWLGKDILGPSNLQAILEVWTG